MFSWHRLWLDGAPILKRAAKISGDANLCWARVLSGRPDGTRAELSDFVSPLGDQFEDCDAHRSAARLASDARNRNRYSVREIAKWAARFKLSARWLKENETYNWPPGDYPAAAPVFLLYALVVKCALPILQRRTGGDGYYAALYGGASVKPKRLTISVVPGFLRTRRANDRCVLLATVPPANIPVPPANTTAPPANITVAPPKHHGSHHKH